MFSVLVSKMVHRLNTVLLICFGNLIQQLSGVNETCATYQVLKNQRKFYVKTKTINEHIPVPDEDYFITFGGGTCRINATDIYKEMLTRQQLLEKQQLYIEIVVVCKKAVVVETFYETLKYQPPQFLWIAISFDGPCSLSFGALSGN